MEPAVYRREHAGTLRRLAEKPKSQWSPPFIGGSTRVPGAGRGLGNGVAMEPAVYRREHRRRRPATPPTIKSQWSPPFIGGSTSRPPAMGERRISRNGARRL